MGYCYDAMPGLSSEGHQASKVFAEIAATPLDI
jgi:hypothetical protein